MAKNQAPSKSTAVKPGAAPEDLAAQDLKRQGEEFPRKPKGSSTAVKPGAAPAAEPAEEVRMKAGRKIHPLVGSTNAKAYPFQWALEAIPVGANGKGGREAVKGNFPPDFSHKSNAYLTKEDFVDEESFFMYKADEARYRMNDYLRLAQGSRLGAAVKDQKGAKRLLKYQQQMADLRKALEADGVDVDALLAAQATPAAAAE